MVTEGLECQGQRDGIVARRLGQDGEDPGYAVGQGRVVGEGGSRAFEVEGGARLPIAPTQDVPAGARLVFRPQHASLGSAGGSGLAGAVTQREFLGATVRYNVRIGASDILIDVPFSDSSALREVGSAVSVEIPLGRARFLTD